MAAHSFDDLKVHIGHDVNVVEYQLVPLFQNNGRYGVVWNVAVECDECGEVLLDFDRPEEEGD